jgi:hypothetical protein
MVTQKPLINASISRERTYIEWSVSGLNTCPVPAHQISGNTGAKIKSSSYATPNVVRHRPANRIVL